jgi:hypothetical protein
MNRRELGKSTARYRRPRFALLLIRIDTPYTVRFFHRREEHRRCQGKSRQKQASYAINPPFSVAEIGQTEYLKFS